MCLAANLMNFELIRDQSFVSLIIWNDVAVLSWNFAQIFLFTLLMLRIYHTFHETPYRVSNWAYYLFGALIFFYVICCAVWYIHNLVIIRAHYTNVDTLFDVYRALSKGYIITVELIDLLISMMLIYLFVKQMVKISVALRDDLNFRKQSVSIRIQSDASVQLNEKQIEIIHSATRYSVLSIIALLSTQLNLLIFCMASMAEWDMNDWVICGIFFCLDCIINSLCLYLLFAANRKAYTLLCTPCHLLFGCCLTRMTQKRVKKQYLMSSNEQIKMQLCDKSEI